MIVTISICKYIFCEIAVYICEAFLAVEESIHIYLLLMIRRGMVLFEIYILHAKCWLPCSLTYLISLYRWWQVALLLPVPMPFHPYMFPRWAAYVPGHAGPLGAALAAR